MDMHLDAQATLFKKKIRVDYSDYPIILEKLHNGDIWGDVKFLFYNSPDDLKGKFTYIDIEKEAPKFIKKNKILLAIWNLIKTETYKANFY